MEKNNWYVANDAGELAGHDLGEAAAKDLADKMREDAPEEGWEALEYIVVCTGAGA